MWSNTINIFGKIGAGSVYTCVYMFYIIMLVLYNYVIYVTTVLSKYTKVNIHVIYLIKTTSKYIIMGTFHGGPHSLYILLVITV